MATERSDIEEAARMALAALAGAGDEASFGLAEKYIPGVKELREENPGSFATGQVGSYLIPGTGIIGGAKALRNLFRAGKAAKSAGPRLSMLSRIVRGAVKGGATGAAESGGQSIIRKSFGTADESSVGDNITSGGAWGAGLGALSPVASSIARRVYSHPAIFNPKSPKSPALMQKLMDEGVWGGESTFRARAAKGKERYSEILDPYRKEMAPKKIDVNDLFLSGYADRERDKKLLGLSAGPQFEKTREGTKKRLGTETPKMGQLQELLNVVNKELATLQPQKRAEVLTGVGGSANNEDQALGALKASIEELERKMITRKHGAKGAADIARAKESYGTGRELERGLDRQESLAQQLRNNLPGDLLAGGAGAGAGLVASGTTALPAILAGAAAVGTKKAAQSLPGRTGMGVVLNKFGKSPTGAAAKAGRINEYAGRGGPEEPEEAPEEVPERRRTTAQNEFMEFVPEPKSAQFNRNIDPEARAASARKLGIKPVALEMIEDPQDEQKRARAAAVLARKKKPAPKKEETEEEENPFLEFVP